MGNQLLAAINEAVIRRLAGPQAYQRGTDYFSHNHVLSCEWCTETLRAVVRGSQEYVVEFTAEDGILDYKCDCSVGGEGAFCKHCVAAALYWLSRQKAEKKTGKQARGPKKVNLAEAAKILLNEDKDALVQFIMGWAKDDRRFREHVLLHAARRIGPDAAVEAARSVFAKAVRVPGYLSQRETVAYVRGVQKAIDSIEQLLADGQAAAGIELSDWALDSLVNAADSLDDSGSRSTELVTRLENIHLKACTEARPDPRTLAKRLFDWKLDMRGEFFTEAISNYGGILGPEGVAAYREIAEAQWAKIPARTAKDKPRVSEKDLYVQSIMEELALLSGDPEWLLQILRRDLSHPHNYLRIARVYRSMGRHEEALQAAEEGLRAFPQYADPSLRQFAIEEYTNKQRHDTAIDLLWAEFCKAPCISAYQDLQQTASGAGKWPQWRERALAEIRSRLERAKAQQPGRASTWLRLEINHSLLVEIFLEEGDIEAAWCEAQNGGCSGALWIRLADARAANHLDEAGPIYLKQAQIAIHVASNGQYHAAIDLLLKAAALMHGSGRTKEFIAALAPVLRQHKHKRNLMNLIEANRKSIYPS